MGLSVSGCACWWCCFLLTDVVVHTFSWLLSLVVGVVPAVVLAVVVVLVVCLANDENLKKMCNATLSIVFCNLFNLSYSLCLPPFYFFCLTLYSFYSFINCSFKFTFPFALFLLFFPFLFPSIYTRYIYIYILYISMYVYSFYVYWLRVCVCLFCWFPYPL